MLVAYPRDFRREYGPQMVQVFCDCWRTTEQKGVGSSLDLWLRTVADLLASATREHLDSCRKDSAMNHWQRNLIAIGGCLAIIVVALFLLSYGRIHEVAPILFFGRILDALVTAGILGNLIVFLLKLTRLDPVKTAFATMLVVNCLLAIVALLIGSRVDPDFRFGSVLFAYIVSFLFWFAVHWVWEKGNTLAIS